MEGKNPVKYHEKDFNIDNYDDFYSHHFFQPLDDSIAINAHRILPRVAWARKVAKERSKDKKGFKVLDLGCLEGFTLLTIANHAYSVSGVGVDLSKEGIAIANARVKECLFDLEFVCKSIEDYMLEFADNTKDEDKYDMITCFEVMEHVKDPELVFTLIDRVKKPDGVALISTPDFEAPTYGKDDEQNKCHIRLYTMADQDYEAVNKYGNTRKATSLSKRIGKERIISMGVYSELINCMYS